MGLGKQLAGSKWVEGTRFWLYRLRKKPIAREILAFSG
jgi:hypothetical protein